MGAEMKLTEEHVRSYIDDIRMIELLNFLTWKGEDVSPTWEGMYMPATRSEDSGLVSLARWNRDHYLFYRALVERYVDKEGDILEVESFGRNFTVEWGIGGFCTGGDVEDILCRIDLRHLPHYLSVVIGNIYENLEMVKDV